MARIDLVAEIRGQRVEMRALWPLGLATLGALLAAPLYIMLLDWPIIRATGWPMFLLAGAAAVAGAMYARWDERAWVRMVGVANLALLSAMALWFFYLARLPAADAKAARLDTAPDFHLTDQDGREISLSGVNANQPVLLVFYRGSWCPFCVSELRGLAGAGEELRSAGVRVMAVSTESRSASQTAAARLDLKFPLLSDGERSVIRDYGLLHKGGGPDGEDIAIPAMFLVQKGGKIVWRRVADRLQDRAAPADILSAVRKKLSAG